MIILLLFLQKQNLAFAVYLFGSVLSSKRLFRGPSTKGIEHRHNPLLLCVPHLPSPAYLLELTHHVRTRPGRRNQRSAVHVASSSEFAE